MITYDKNSLDRIFNKKSTALCKTEHFPPSPCKMVPRVKLSLQKGSWMLLFLPGAPQLLACHIHTVLVQLQFVSAAAEVWFCRA